MLPLREIDFSAIENPLHQMVTWDSKWVPDSPEWNAMPVIMQPAVSHDLRGRIEDVALRTYRAFDCRDYARVDVMVRESGEPVVLEVNTLPGMTETSLLPKAAAAAGIGYAELCQRMVDLAMKRTKK